MTKIARAGLLRRLVGLVRSATDVSVVVIFWFMVVAVVGEIVGRTFNLKVSNAVETASFAQIWLTAIGASVALRFGSMFALDTITRHLELHLARVLSVVIAVFSLVLVAVIFYGGIVLTEAGVRQLSPVQRIPMWIIFMGVPVGMALLALEIVLRVVERWDDPFGGVQEDDA